MASEDDARLLAALTTALHASNVRNEDGASFEARLLRLQETLSGHYWQVVVAERMKISLRAWMGHPWQCWKLRQLVGQLQAGDMDPSAEAAAIDRLTRYAAIVEFGIGVNAVWYRKLRSAVALGLVTRGDMRSLLWRCAVHWGVFRRSGMRQPSERCSFAWRMGRPAGDELVVARHPRAARWFLFGQMLGACASFGLLSGSVSHYLFHVGDTTGIGRPLAFCYIAGVLAWFGWRFGSRSWNAAGRLEMLLVAVHPRVGPATSDLGA